MALAATIRDNPPRVDLDSTGLPTTAAQITVTRTVDGEVWPVRGAGDSYVPGSPTWSGTDREVPVGRTVTYRIVAARATGATVATQTVTVTVPDINPGMAWLSDPLDETVALPVHLQVGTDEDRTGSRDVRLAQPIGAAWPVGTIGRMSRLTDWQLVVVAHDETLSAALRDLQQQALIVCVRTSAQLHLPPLLYVAITAHSEQVWHEQLGQPTPRWRARHQWTCAATRGTELSPSVYAWTWGDVKALGITWAQAAARWPQWRDVKRGD